MCFGWLIPLLVIPAVILLTLPLTPFPSAATSLMGFASLVLVGGVLSITALVFGKGRYRGAYAQGVAGVLLTMAGLIVILSSCLILYHSDRVKAAYHRRQKLREIERASNGIETARSDYIVPELAKPADLLVRPMPPSVDQATSRFDPWKTVASDPQKGTHYFSTQDDWILVKNRFVPGPTRSQVFVIDNDAHRYHQTRQPELLDLVTGEFHPIGPPHLVDIDRCSEGFVFTLADGSIIVYEGDDLSSGRLLEVPQPLRHEFGTSSPNGEDLYRAEAAIASETSPLVYVIQIANNAVWVFNAKTNQLVAHAIPKRLVGTDDPWSDIVPERSILFLDGNVLLTQTHHLLLRTELADTKFVTEEVFPIVGLSRRQLVGPLQTSSGPQCWFLSSRRGSQSQRIEQLRIRFNPLRIRETWQTEPTGREASQIVLTEDFMVESLRYIKNNVERATRDLLIYRVSDQKHCATLLVPEGYDARYLTAGGGNFVMMGFGSVYVINLDQIQSRFNIEHPPEIDLAADSNR
ncbi:hypothetical protein Poly41_24830 [Novipirellula artificiosorum]|uniref:Uncharacterized protein n=2 Tax=Novipirellula artificiosorum TaxID=2528016 RepID=A0A5C6DS79_9BACT|nr:hypothetical protein Poly41_24830 [Novipirellula artificiosorum]